MDYEIFFDTLIEYAFVAVVVCVMMGIITFWIKYCIAKLSEPWAYYASVGVSILFMIIGIAAAKGMGVI